MDEQIMNLALNREILEDAKTRRAAMLAVVTDSEDYKAETAVIEQAQAAIADATRLLQTAALDAYAATGTKKPHPAIGVRVNTQVVYDPDKALEWSRSNLLAAVTLDRKMFEAHAKAVAKTQPIPFVALVQTPSITIASDLSEYLPEPEPTDFDVAFAWIEQQEKLSLENIKPEIEGE
jgi:hypothetical protein